MEVSVTQLNFLQSFKRTMNNKTQNQTWSSLLVSILEKVRAEVKTKQAGLPCDFFLMGK